ncbi:MAG TPA: hypothetical protein VJ377_10135 [Dehalococcoidales bacterium]|nr:MAG: hypothetical protein A2Z05_02620 [Chloroflexi bacterium RBG_16_60_22]HJX13864.1 hypothetical protein [Dehalococcoidales bacterium]
MGITFFGTDDGHAVNAFETTDKGLVYIDCTNGNAPEDRDGEIKSWDTVAYVEKGEKYGIIPIEIVAGSKFDYYPFGYDFYTDYERKWREYEALLDAHNEAVDKYNRDIGGRVFTYGTPAARRIAEREQELQAQGETITALETELGGTWYESEFSSYTIKEVLVHW